MESALQSIEECKAVGTDPTMHELKVGTIVDEIKCAARDSLVYSNALGPVQVRLLSARTPHGHVVSVVDLLSSLGPTLGAAERSICLAAIRRQDAAAAARRHRKKHLTLCFPLAFPDTSA